MEAQENQVALPLRSHTILGVCEALGEDFGFNPMFLRVPLAASVLYSVTWAIGAYLALGLVVLGSRLLFPAPKRQKLHTTVDAPAAEERHEYAKAA
jgi:phage shock protein C